MHELLLFGQVPAARYEQMLNILAGLTAMQPQRVVELHEQYRPARHIQRTVQVGGSQGVQSAQKKALQDQLNKDLYYAQLVRTLDDDILLHGVAGEQRQTADGMNSRIAGAQAPGAWSLQLNETPEPEKRSAILRATSNIDIIDGDPRNYMVALGYSFISDYVLEGHRFIHNNVVLLLHRVLQSSAEAKREIMLQSPNPPYDMPRPLDDSGGYILQASVRLRDKGKPEVLTAGLNELENFKARMKGVVDLKAPDRLSLDTRLR